MTRMSATRLRQNLYQILDQVLDTGVAVDVERKGETLRIVPVKAVSKLERLEPHNAARCDPKDLIETTWLKEWSEEKNL